MKDRSTAILGMLGIYLVYKAPRGVVCKWLLTSRSNFVFCVWLWNTNACYKVNTHTLLRVGCTDSTGKVRGLEL